MRYFYPLTIQLILGFDGELVSKWEIVNMCVESNYFM